MRSASLVRVVSTDEARRIAVRAQLLDGSQAGVLETVRRLGYLQIDPISTVAPPQHLVLFSRLGAAYDRAELDRLLWDERELFEWGAFIRPIEDWPLIRARSRRRWGGVAWERHALEFLQENAKFRRYVLRELERRGPLPSRELAHDLLATPRTDHRWWGSRKVTLMLEILHGRGEIAVAGRQGKQRLWDLTERVFPETERILLRDAERLLGERRRRALGVWLERGEWHVHPEATDGPVPDRVTVLSPFDRLIHDRDRAEALFGFHYRLEMYVPKAKREFGYYVLPILCDGHLIGRIEPVFDRKAGVLRVNGVWAQPDAPADTGADIGAGLRELAGWLGAATITVGKNVPRAWAKALRAAV